MFLLTKLIRLPYVQMMIKECNQLIQQKRMSNDLVNEKEESKYNNIIKRYKND